MKLPKRTQKRFNINDLLLGEWASLFYGQREVLRSVLTKIIYCRADLVSDVAPDDEDIFRVFTDMGPDKVKVLVLGQDPYPMRGAANGRAFGLHSNYKGPIPQSLSNVEKELGGEGTQILSFYNPSLSDWAHQGVFLMNSALTVEIGKPGSHLTDWRPFISATLDYLFKRKPDLVCLALGAKSYKLIKQAGFNSVLTTTHPSPLSANKGFIGSGIFRKVNDLLISRGETPIKWGPDG